MEDIKRIPKVELHCHLEGSVAPETVYELIREQTGREYALAYISRKIQADASCNSLKEYLKKFDLIVSCLQTSKALQRVAEESVVSAARQGIIYIEIRFAPQLLRQDGLSCRRVIQDVLIGLEAGQKKTGTIANAILICMRNHTVEQNLEVVEAAREFRCKGVVAIDLAGDEALYPPLTQRAVFCLAQKYGIPFTIHAGECGKISNIKDAILLGASRLGHGILAKYDQNIIEFLARRDIGVEMCPTSNLQTHSVESWEEYPIRQFYENGVRIAVCTDNPTVSNTNLNGEIAILIQRFNFTLIEIKELMMNSIQISFASRAEKKRLRRIVESKFRGLLQEREEK